MKKNIYFIAVAMAFASCNASTDTNNSSENNSETVSEASSESNEEVKKVGDYYVYGEEISPDNALSVDELSALLAENDSIEVKFASKVNSVCKKKGCWMKVDMGGNFEEMRVKFKDYAFFVPLDAEESEVILEGMAYIETTSVEMLKHYAEDAGKSEEEIAQIEAPETKLTFMAKGVLMKN